MRVRVAHRDYTLTESRPEEWLLIEWPEGEKKPTKYWLSTLPKDITFRKLVDIAKLRWRIERDYQELKQELGLGHFEGRAVLARLDASTSARPPASCLGSIGNSLYAFSKAIRGDIPEQEYQAKCYKPDFDDLPWSHEYQAAEKKDDHTQRP